MPRLNNRAAYAHQWEVCFNGLRYPAANKNASLAAGCAPLKFYGMEF
jgi:hypothetical protein